MLHILHQQARKNEGKNKAVQGKTSIQYQIYQYWKIN